MSSSTQIVTSVLALVIICVTTKETELPLCPTNVNFLPQGLPMHCRMPRNANYPFPGMLPNLTFPPLPPLFQNPPPDKQSPPMPFPMPPGLGPPPMPMPVPMMPMPPPGPAHKLPVIVMPFYSPDTSKKPKPPNSGHHGQKKRRIHINKKRKRYHADTDSSDTDDSQNTSSDSSSDSDAGWWRGRRNGGRPRSARRRRVYRNNRDLLTPVLQYVTKDGYVIYEKKISKNEANDWMQEKKEDIAREFNDPPKGEQKQKQEDDVEEFDKIIEDSQRRQNTRTKIIEDAEKAQVRVYKNTRKRKAKKSPKKKEENR